MWGLANSLASERPGRLVRPGLPPHDLSALRRMTDEGERK